MFSHREFKDKEGPLKPKLRVTLNALVPIKKKKKKKNLCLVYYLASTLCYLNSL